jgi:hypothetical protein
MLLFANLQVVTQHGVNGQRRSLVDLDPAAHPRAIRDLHAVLSAYHLINLSTCMSNSLDITLQTMLDLHDFGLCERDLLRALFLRAAAVLVYAQALGSIPAARGSKALQDLEHILLGDDDGLRVDVSGKICTLVKGALDETSDVQLHAESARGQCSAPTCTSA